MAVRGYGGPGSGSVKPGARKPTGPTGATPNPRNRTGLPGNQTATNHNSNRGSSLGLGSTRGGKPGLRPNGQPAPRKLTKPPKSAGQRGPGVNPGGPRKTGGGSGSGSGSGGGNGGGSGRKPQSRSKNMSAAVKAAKSAGGSAKGVTVSASGKASFKNLKAGAARLQARRAYKKATGRKVTGTKKVGKGG